MSGCVSLCSLRHFFFFFLIGPLPVPAHFIFSRCPFVFMLGVSVSDVTFCLVGTWNGDVKGCCKKTGVPHLCAVVPFFFFFSFSFFLYLFCANLIPPQLPNHTWSKIYQQLCPAVLTPALNQSAAGPSLHSYYSSKCYHTKPVFFSAPSSKSSQGGLVWFK